MTDLQLLKNAESIDPWVIEIRRKLHQIPELGFREHKTQRFIIETLDKLNIPNKSCRTGVIAEILGTHSGKTIALRADIDALPVTELSECSFASTHPGLMHACGHDAHTAILLGAARLLNEMKSDLHGSVRLLFQPAEESEGGAKPLIEAGAMQGISEVYGLHMAPSLTAGEVETRVGTMNAAADTLSIRVKGKRSHGAYPDLGADAIVAAAAIITSLQSIVARNVSPLECAVVSIGQIEGGTATNIMCSDVLLQGTIRSTQPALRALLHKRVTEMSEHIAMAYGCKAEVNILRGYPPLINDKACAEKVLAVATRLFGEKKALTFPASSMGAEDFSYYLEKAPGAFYNLGCSSPDNSNRAPLHNEKFVVDESCLKTGVAMQVALALEALA